MVKIKDKKAFNYTRGVRKLLQMIRLLRDIKGSIFLKNRRFIEEKANKLKYDYKLRHLTASKVSVSLSFFELDQK